MPCRQYTVFSMAELSKPDAQAGNQDLPDDFYELTPADVQRELAAVKRKQAYSEAGLRTKARCDNCA